VNPMSEESAPSQQDSEHIQAVRRAHEQELLAKANVVGVGIGYRRTAGQTTREMALVVMVTRKQPAARLAEHDRIPRAIDGVPVDVQEVGQINAL
jgi:hypothetical protein